ncbi:MAG: YlxM family DNA-binding protein [Clostridia bacterium]|nr:YlxM family DNA-binding protein [Clostridia bacterium]
MAKNLEITILLDFYGEMLTSKQREFLDFYYNEDLSLAEIAANVGITRQGVRDAIKRAECLLYDMEQRLGLVARFKDVQNGLDEIMDCATKISAENRKNGLSREISDLTVKIKSIALSLSE